MRRKIEDKLLELGITPNLKGFAYICESVEMILDDPGVKMQTIYNSVGKSNLATARSVERCIRHCVKKIEKCKKNTNSEFVYEIALMIKREVDDE